ncbi:zinc ribbon domain-containing protein YjdM, partial [Sulfurovum sp.]|uniref:zinc ribbon domain-containing protein YjdM n=1 Tax=Sulfurovum sp. TaxID=1969726 RepID=UPI0025D0277E
MENIPNCPKCGSEYTYEDGELYICPECAYEWSKTADEEAEAGLVVRDANGNILEDGDTVTVIKDLKVKGSSSG